MHNAHTAVITCYPKDALDMTPCTELNSENFERLGSEEITHILCGAVEKEVSYDTRSLQSTDPHQWTLDSAIL